MPTLGSSLPLSSGEHTDIAEMFEVPYLCISTEEWHGYISATEYATKK